jgi:hypothetical protein
MGQQRAHLMEREPSRNALRLRGAFASSLMIPISYQGWALVRSQTRGMPLSIYLRFELEKERERISALLPECAIWWRETYCRWSGNHAGIEGIEDELQLETLAGTYRSAAGYCRRRQPAVGRALRRIWSDFSPSMSIPQSCSGKQVFFFIHSE